MSKGGIFGWKRENLFVNERYIASDASSSPPLENQSDKTQKSPLANAGASLSNPNDAALANRTNNARESTLKGFTPEHQLLASLVTGGKQAGDAAPPGPEFPLKAAYNPETPYQTKEGKPTQRGEELQKEAKQLIQAVAKPDGSLSLRDHGKILDAIAHNKELSEADKWYLYKQVCKQEATGRDEHGKLIPGTHATRVLFDSEKPTGLPESGKGDVVRHIVIDPTDDSYHGGLVYGGSSWRAGYMSGESGIEFHERVEKPLVNFTRGQGLGSDPGDEQASYRQLKALRAMQQGGFNAYAKSWNEGFGK